VLLSIYIFFWGVVLVWGSDGMYVCGEVCVKVCGEAYMYFLG